MQITGNENLTFLARLLASLLAVLFVLTGLAGLVLFNLERRAFDPAAYKQALLSQDFYQKFPFLLGDLLTKNLKGNAPAFIQNLSTDQWTGLLEDLLPQQQVRSMLEDTLDHFFAYINDDTLTPGISLLPLKNSLAGPAGMDAALTIIRAQPECTIEQIANMLFNFGQELCNPPKAMLNLLQPVIQLQLQAAASAIPDNISILQGPNSGVAAPGLTGLRSLRLLMRLSPLIPLVLLLCITLLAVRSLKDWLIWWGWPLSFTGLIGFPLTLSGAPFFSWLLERWLSKHIILTLTPAIAVSLRSVANEALREILKPAVFESLVLFIIGLIMMLFFVYLIFKEKKKVSSSEAETQIS